MKKRFSHYGFAAALVIGAAGMLPATAYGAVNTYSLPGGNGKISSSAAERKTACPAFREIPASSFLT